MGTESKGDEIVIPVAEERATIDRQKKEVGTVTLRKTVVEEQRFIDEPFLQERAMVTRIPVNREVTEPIAPYERDGALVIPLYQEVVKKQLILKEEIVVSKRRTERHELLQVPLREERLDVVRHVHGGPAGPDTTPE